MPDEKLDIIVANEKEWRKYMVKKIDLIERDFHSFKFRMIGFITVLVTVAEAVKVIVKQ